MDNLPDCCYDYRYEAPSAKIVDICNICGNNIYEGEEYYDFHGDIVCYDCSDEYIREFKRS
ncbi:hypothetical protein NSA27_02425 [Clostridium tepidum]|uniref:hypothetical protein n=1 Tax=Clostridium tepidum TaxID=1962263 RepID=UPI00214A4546|nr:hypothetical protein [Clostridium tepidum]MCR1933558.1 hypothetical protein [Clostridium tepidum]